MEELIFFAVIIFFSIIDSIARRKKKQGEIQIPEAPEPRRERQRSVPRYDTEPEAQTRTTYEAEPMFEARPTYDDAASYDDAPSYDDEAGVGSQGMIPADIWEEIAGLAKGRLPAPPPPRRVEVQRVPPKPAKVHPVHLAHAGYGTDPSSRRPSEQDGLDPLAVRANADALAVRATLRRKGSHALRQAVMLQEILGPPVGLRENHRAD